MNHAAELLTPAGEELLDRLRGVTVTPELALRLAEELRDRYPAELVAAALTQQSLRIAGREKFSRADDMFFTRAGLEQASAEVLARHSARRFLGLPLVADLCCGIGGDLMALAASADRVLAVDADLNTLRFARRNVAAQASAASAGTFVRRCFRRRCLRRCLRRRSVAWWPRRAPWPRSAPCCRRLCLR